MYAEFVAYFELCLKRANQLRDANIYLPIAVTSYLFYKSVD